MGRFWSLLTMAVFVLFFVVPQAHAEGPPIAEQVRGLTHHTQEGVEASEAGDVAWLKAEYEELHAIWGSFSEEVKAQDPTGYAEIEAGLATIASAVAGEAPDLDAARAAFADLTGELDEVAERLGGATVAAPVAEPSAEVTTADLLTQLETAQAAVEQGDSARAAEAITTFIQFWPSVEGTVVARSQEDYRSIEQEMGRAAAALRAEPANLAAAEQAIESLHATLLPFVGAQKHYTALDAAAILLREGLEAMLVVVALLAFLKRSGNEDKEHWLWVGAGGGVLASIMTAFLLQVLFSRVGAGQNREVIEGATGLIAAAMLFYISYWLHSKANIQAWQRYINQQTTHALAKGSMASLALLSFLAIFREGAETAIFYIGMAPSISMNDLLLGISAALVLLALVAFLILRVGVRLPMRPFFLISGLLVYYLGFKFVGNGIKALQVAGLLPTTPLAHLPSLPSLGFYPTWESLLPQLILLATAVAVVLSTRLHARRVTLTLGS